MAVTEGMASRLLLATLMAILMVATGTVVYLSMGLSSQTGETLHYPASGLTFAFGSGHPVGDQMLVDEFANGYALLSSGPISIQADEQRVLSYNWLPPGMPQEAAFFWRRSDDSQNVNRTEITTAGTQLIHLSGEPDWHGEITELGFLVAGVNGQTVEIGDTSLLPESLTTRLQLTWQAWSRFEEWSQQSINFLHGGDYRQVVSLPLLIVACLSITLLLLWLFTGKRTNAQQFLTTAGLVILAAWVVLDIRWTTNNLRQIRLSLQNQWQAEDRQNGIGLDGVIQQYVKDLKREVLGEQPVRILIVGDETAVDYYLLRAKYHLLPHSIDVAGEFAKKLAPKSLDFVIFFGQASGITKVPGWNSTWRQSLVQVDRSEWGVVYRVD